MPAFNAEKTLEATYNDLPELLRKRVILVDDGSSDQTVEIARGLGLQVIVHSSNMGYGANQKTCYKAALNDGAKYVVMVHPDYQYDARMALVMVEIIALGNCDVVLGNRIRTRQEALKGGMPLWKYLANRVSTFAENLILGQSIGDFHSGMRAYSREVLEILPIDENSDDFAFDQEFLVQAVAADFRIGDVPVPVRYMSEASSIDVRRSLIYAWGGLGAVFAYLFHKISLRKDSRFQMRTGQSDV
ncbi:glycosyltransferase family 2 protein [bacterium]|nr:glycosyltransferase family 2 protein [bacterium]